MVLTYLSPLCKTDNNSSYMATSFSSKKTSFNKIFIIVFGIAFGLMALAMGFKGVKNTSDIRSRASEAHSIFKQWEFNGQTSEDWVSVPVNGIIRGGLFTFSLPAHKTPNELNTDDVSKLNDSQNITKFPSDNAVLNSAVVPVRVLLVRLNVLLVRV